MACEPAEGPWLTSRCSRRAAGQAPHRFGNVDRRSRLSSKALDRKQHVQLGADLSGGGAARHDAVARHALLRVFGIVIAVFVEYRLALLLKGRYFQRNDRIAPF